MQLQAATKAQIYITQDSLSRDLIFCLTTRSVLMTAQRFHLWQTNMPRFGRLCITLLSVFDDSAREEKAHC